METRLIAAMLRFKPGGEHVFRLHEGNTPFLSFRRLDETGIVKNAFSTRFGGVSESYLSSLNFSYGKEGETREHVTENYRRMARAMEVDPARMVVSWQTHTTNVRLVTKKDAGKGIFLPRDYQDIDGLICDTPGITLVTLYADCVPLYLVDTKRRAIGLSHSGWRGTVGRMGAATIGAMKEAFGTNPEDLICCIGPSICLDCFEVGDEVAEAFSSAFGLRAESFMERQGEKYHIDLWRANAAVFEEAGVPKNQIVLPGLCTKCNKDVLWSHRANGVRRGNLAAFLCLN